MAFTYGGDPANSDLEWVRHVIGDNVDPNDSHDVTLNDAEINSELADRSNRTLAAAYCVKRLMARAARIVSGGGQSPDRGSMIRQLQMLLDELMAEAISSGASEATYGGTSLADNETLQDDTDIPDRSFSIGMDDHPGS